MRLQSVIRAIYPAQCVACEAMTDAENGLCGPCRRDTPFIGGVICDTCGAPLQGDDDGQILQCDDCMTTARPWDRGRALWLYDGVARRLILRLKHGDRTDLAMPVGQWLKPVVQDILRDDTLLVPVPLHWTRLIRRRYNQAALLAQALGHSLDRQVCVDGLLRRGQTKPLEGVTRAERFALLDGMIGVNPRRRVILRDRHVLLVDDVMTTGATLAACAAALNAAGVASVCVVTLARVVKDA